MQESQGVMTLFELVAAQGLRQQQKKASATTGAASTKRGAVSWVERIESALNSSGGQATMSAILGYIESHHPDVAGYNYNWKATVKFTLHGNDQFEKLSDEGGGLWRLCQLEPEVPPWEKDTKRWTGDEELKHSGERRKRRRCSSRDRSRSPRRRSRKSKSTRYDSDDDHRKRSHSSRKRKSSRRNERSRSDRGKSKLCSKSEGSEDESPGEAVAHLDLYFEWWKELQEKQRKVREELEASEHIAERSLEMNMPKGEHRLEQAEQTPSAAADTDTSVGCTTLAQNLEKPVSSAPTEASKVPEAVPSDGAQDSIPSTKSKDEELLELYTKQQRQEDQSDAMQSYAQMYGYSYGYPYGYYAYGYGMDQSAWQQYSTVDTAIQEFYGYTAEQYYSGEGIQQPGSEEDTDGKKKSKKPTPEFWKAYKEKKRRKKAATRFNLKG